MKKAVILYQSKTGTTQNYADEIGSYLQSKNINTQCVPVGEYRDDLLHDADYLLMGCWTKGLMVVFQKPDDVWSRCVQKIHVPQQTRVALFATYKIRTGSMFRNMAKHVMPAGNSSLTTLKSRHGNLTEYDKFVLDEFLKN